MTRKTFIASVVLEGYQAILIPSKFGYSLAGTMDEDLIPQLKEDRRESLEWCKSKLKNPKRSSLNPEPWEKVSENKYKIKFSWNEEVKPKVVDTDCVEIKDTSLPLVPGCKVRVAFYQKPYILKDGITYGTSFKSIGVQVVSLSEPSMLELFGKIDGYKIG